MSTYANLIKENVASGANDTLSKELPFSSDDAQNKKIKVFFNTQSPLERAKELNKELDKKLMAKGVFFNSYNEKKPLPTTNETAKNEERWVILNLRLLKIIVNLLIKIKEYRQTSLVKA